MSNTTTTTNSTSLDPSDYCTLSICSLSDAYVNYIPSLGGNIFYAAVFAVLLIAQLILGIRYRTWGYLTGLFGGLLLEIIGYIGRIQMHYNPFKFTPYLEYLICLTIAPALLSASIYICLTRIITLYCGGTAANNNLSLLQPKTYTYLFIICDLVSLILQAAGGAITSTADADQADLAQTGVNIMIAGLASQVVSLVLFMGLCGEFAYRVWKNPYRLNGDARMREVRGGRLWRGFLGGLSLATITIFIRSVFRVAELKGGFHSKLANDEVKFMVLEGAMIVLATSALTVLHPGLCFGGLWKETKWSRSLVLFKGYFKIG
ncbi:RTA1 domain-containing protein [Aspergillus vadensis CBS 113365]|uniref:RTA1 domain protein n=1 Tax=Aspergillus vadensis (strain CBS 113365 / IMI 142717 / IBT 24658) TaxID=1448311 RepID=A0A319BEW2_ASPVC|nr:RTA1 domain protein [Aspergillus vadensis CBS 113365]PYH70661.1 RTA1 domain protein [Aspergillus vadensis CBS 113365]